MPQKYNKPFRFLRRIVSHRIVNRIPSRRHRIFHVWRTIYMKSGPSSLVLFPNQFGAFSQQVVRTRRAKSGVQSRSPAQPRAWARRTRARSGCSPMLPTWPRLCRRAHGQSCWRETAWDRDGGSYCHSDTLDCKHVRETQWGATGGQDPVSVCVADLRKWGCGVWH